MRNIPDNTQQILRDIEKHLAAYAAERTRPKAKKVRGALEKSALSGAARELQQIFQNTIDLAKSTNDHCVPMLELLSEKLTAETVTLDELARGFVAAKTNWDRMQALKAGGIDAVKAARSAPVDITQLNNEHLKRSTPDFLVEQRPAEPVQKSTAPKPAPNFWETNDQHSRSIRNNIG